MKSIVRVVAFLILVSGVQARAGSDIMKDFDSFGGNDALLERANVLSPDKKVEVIQDRIVSRKHRFEFDPEYQNVLGGDAYNNTQSVGINAQFHITEHWSVGVKYAYDFNQLTTEGNFLLTDTAINGQGMVPDIDYPKQEALALVNWYPIYGKMNLYDLGVVHFDVYGLVGGGGIQLKSGTTAAYTGGLGVGLWLSQHLTTRVEYRFETYEAQRLSGATRINANIASFQVGYML
jgi:outer membrane immunogenic protein